MTQHKILLRCSRRQPLARPFPDFRSFHPVRSLSPAPPESKPPRFADGNDVPGRAIRHHPTVHAPRRRRFLHLFLEASTPIAIEPRARSHGATPRTHQGPGRREYVRLRARLSLLAGPRRRPPFLSAFPECPAAPRFWRDSRGTAAAQRSLRFRSRRRCCPWRYGWGRAGVWGKPHPSTSGLQVGHARDCSRAEPATNAARRVALSAP